MAYACVLIAGPPSVESCFFCAQGRQRLDHKSPPPNYLSYLHVMQQWGASQVVGGNSCGIRSFPSNCPVFLPSALFNYASSDVF